MQCSAFLQYIVAPIVLLTVWAGAVGSLFTCQSVIDMQKSVSQRTLEQNSFATTFMPWPRYFCNNTPAPASGTQAHGGQAYFAPQNQNLLASGAYV